MGGTGNFEGCAGVVGMLEYFVDLAGISMEVEEGLVGRILKGEEEGKRWIREAYGCVELAESFVCSRLLDR